MDKLRIDSHKIHYHPEWIADFLHSRTVEGSGKDPAPIYLEIGLVGACNHRCSFCAVDYLGYKSNRLDLSRFTNFASDISAAGVKSIMFAGEGEPFLHKEASSFAKVCGDNGIDVGWTTNATVIPSNFLTDGIKNSSWIKASVNGGDAQSYHSVHRGKVDDFDRVKDNIKAIVEARNATGSSCAIGVQMVITPDNKGSVEQLMYLCRDELGVDYLVFKPYSRHLSSTHSDIFSGLYWDLSALEKQANDLSSDAFQIIVRSSTLQSVAIDSHQYERSQATPYAWGYVMANGDFYSCSAFLGDERFKLGNINEETFNEIWFGSRRSCHKDFVSNSLNISECRKGCRMNHVNKFLDEVINDKAPHKNFI